LCIIIEFDQEEQRHLEAVEKAISEHGKLSHTTIHGVILGLARSGKDCLMKRLLNEKATAKSLSTGVVETAVQVKVEKTSISVDSIASSWTRLESENDEVIEILTQLTSRQNSLELCTKESVKLGSTVMEVTKTEEVSNPDLRESKLIDINHSNDLSGSKPQESSLDTIDLTAKERSGFKEEKTNKSNEDTNEHIECIDELPSINVPVHQKSEREVKHKPVKLFQDALDSSTFEHLSLYLENHWTLYLSNTGGQMEFQHLLPLLVSGPSMYFITFRLDKDLNDAYEIEYEVAGKESIKYPANTTQLENILQNLTSINALGTFSNSDKTWKKHKCKIFIIGTHYDVFEGKKSKDQISEGLKAINESIYEAVEKFRDSIVFAQRKEPVFTVNNFSDDDTDFQYIRSCVQKIVSSGFFRTESPASWLIYSVLLRHDVSPIADYDTCFKLANDCGIMDDTEHKEALHFMHSKTGTIRYFPINDSLSKVVFRDPDVLFNKVTDLISNTFTFEQTNHCQTLMDEFKCNGTFSFNDYEKFQDPCRQPEPKQFLNLLEHLRIAARFHDKEEQKLKYFLPCAMAHFGESCKDSSGTLPSVLVTFKCGYCPMGVGYALVKYLMTEKVDSYNTWEFVPEYTRKNQVFFLVHPTLDTVSLKIMSTHLEIQLSIDDPDDDVDAYATCAQVCKTVKVGITTIMNDIKYVHDNQFSFTFYCEGPECKANKSRKHPARLALSQTGEPKNLICPKNKKSRHNLPKNWEYWFKQHERLDKLAGLCTPSHHAILFGQLDKYAAKWKNIGTFLGFEQNELDIIQAMPLLLSDAPKSWLSEMLKEWLQWAPGPGGRREYAKLESLKKALRDTDPELNEIAASLQL
jgi:ankyrin